MRRRWNLLVVEDNYPDALLVEEAIRMEDLPLDMHIASDGEQALQFINRAEQDWDAPHPHFLLLDLNLPKIEGFEVLRRIRASEQFGRIPALVISSSGEAHDRALAASLGASYFRKSPLCEEFFKLGTVLKQLMADNGAL